MEIREAIAPDIPQITEMKKREDYERYIKRIKESEGKKAIYLVAIENEQIVGHVFFKFYGTPRHPDYPEIEDLFVREDLRSLGIGAKIIEKCEQLAKESGFSKIGLGVNPELNPRAKAFYERLDYQVIENDPYLDGVYDGVEDWVIDMVKEI